MLRIELRNTKKNINIKLIELRQQKQRRIDDERNEQIILTNNTTNAQCDTMEYSIEWKGIYHTKDKEKKQKNNEG
jgi:hypothetical protein